MNNGSFIGRVGRDAQTRFTTNGKPVTSFSVAVDVGFGDNKSTLWLDCALWGDRGEKIVDYIRKGDRIGVIGEVGTREHEGKTYVTLNVRDVTLLGEKRDGGSSADAPRERQAPARQAQERWQSPQSRDSGGSLEDDDIPFAPPITRRNWSALT